MMHTYLLAFSSISPLLHSSGTPAYGIVSHIVGLVFQHHINLTNLIKALTPQTYPQDQPSVDNPALRFSSQVILGFDKLIKPTVTLYNV